MSRRARDRQRGVAAIELGLILPILCFLIFGLIDYGYWFTIDLAATNAVREGARIATTYAGDCPNASATSAGAAAITSYMSNSGLSALGGNANCVCAEVAASPQFTCNFNVVFARLTGYSLVPMPGGSGNSTSVTTTAVMRGTP